MTGSKPALNMWDMLNNTLSMYEYVQVLYLCKCSCVHGNFVGVDTCVNIARPTLKHYITWEGSSCSSLVPDSPTGNRAQNQTVQLVIQLSTRQSDCGNTA